MNNYCQINESLLMTIEYINLSRCIADIPPCAMGECNK